MKRKVKSFEFIRMIREAILIIEEIDRLYPTDFDCALALTGRFEEPGAWKCKKCGSSILNEEKYEVRWRRAFRCSNCRTLNYITAGTSFERIHEPRAKLCYIKIAEKKLTLCSDVLDKLLGVAGSTVWRIGRMMAAIMGQSFSSENAMFVESAEFLNVFDRRSCDSMRREHPRAEQEAYENDLKQQEAASQSCSQQTADTGEAAPENYDLDDAETLVYSVLSSELQDVDRICDLCSFSVAKVLGILTILEMLGMIEHLPGNYYVRSRPSKFVSSSSSSSIDESPKASASAQNATVDPEQQEAIKAFNSFVRSVFHSVSRKHLQSYLSIYWLRVSTRWQNGGLLQAWRNSPEEVYLNACSMVSPLYVWLPKWEIAG